MELKVSKINTSKKIYLKLVLSIIFIILTSGFNHDTSVQKVPSYMLDLIQLLIRKWNVKDWYLVWDKDILE